jgi:HemY protein
MMLWSLGRVLVFVLIVAVATWVVAAMIETGQQIRIAAFGWEVTLGPVMAMAGAVALAGAIWLAMRMLGGIIAILRFLAGDETAVSRYFDRSRERRGQAALADALFALAAGEGKRANERAGRARRLLGQIPVTTLISAQAALAAGDRDGARAGFGRLLETDPGRPAALRGLMQIALAEGDTAAALRIAQAAFQAQPRNPETQDVLLKLQTGARDWTGARATLRAERDAGRIARDVWERRDAVLALQEARGVLDVGASIEAREKAIEANRRSPDLIPAAAMAARGYIERGKPREAARVLEKAWSVRPHPDLAATYAEIVLDETPAARVKRFAALISTNPAHTESRLIEAELLIAAEDFPAARRALGDLAAGSGATARALALMAAVERGQGSDDAVVRGWLARALSAPRGPQWACGDCHTVHPDWTPVCASCGGFDTLDWTDIPETYHAGPAAASAMLPLIVERGTKAAETAAPPAPKPKTGAEAPEDDLAQRVRMAETRLD